MADKASRGSFSLYELQMNSAPPTGDDSLSPEERDAILDLDDDAFNAELDKYIEKGRLGGAVESTDPVLGSGSYYARLNSEGLRLVTERHKRREQPLRDAWRPDDISEADQYAEPLRTVVAFRLLCGQYVAIANISFESLKDNWKRSKLCDLFTPMADDVAAAMVATNEDPKGFFRALSFCNEKEQMRFVDAWRVEILPTLKTVEIKLKNATNGTVVNGNAPLIKQPETAKLSKIKRCERDAYLAHKYAEAKEGRQLTDPEAWEYLNYHGIGDDGDDLKGYQVPLKGTYADYMNKARRQLGEPKYKPRGERAAGLRSVQKRSEL